MAGAKVLAPQFFIFGSGNYFWDSNYRDLDIPLAPPLAPPCHTWRINLLGPFLNLTR
jgi:hypothetical protein